MIWFILGAALLVVVVTFAVIRLRHAQRTLDAILAEHHERMDNNTDNPNGPAQDDATPHHQPASHRRHGRRSAVRANGGYDLHRRMSA
jgi:ABC-type nickel/cobalt efflux system permease component RcnA